MKDLASIVIPCYNQAAYIGDAIESAINQSHPRVEVIVIDDGSTDGSREVIETFADQIRYERQVNQGAPEARNRGLKMASGTYVKFLDADDVLLAQAVERQVERAEALDGERKAIVYGEAVWVDEDGNEISGHNLRPRDSGEDPVAHILSSNPLTSCPLHRRKYLVEVGGFAPSVPRGQEFDLHLRLVLAGVSFEYNPMPVYRYRHYDDQSRISGQGYSGDDPQALRKVVLRHEELIREQRGSLAERIRVLLARRLWAYGRGILREGMPDAAEPYFAEARRLAGRNGIEGHFPYPTLAASLGPKYAEICLGAVKDTVSFLKTPFR